MAKYAYRDLNHEDKVLAKDVLPSEQEFIFYCANKECSCQFRIAAINSNKVRPYFAKLPSSTHIENCWNDIEFSDSGDIDDYDFSDFTPDSLLDEISKIKKDTIVNKGGDTRKPITKTDKKGEIQYIHTIRQLYAVCLSNANDDYINGIAIRYLFAGRKTLFLYTRYILGIKLVECAYHSYDRTTNTIRFKFPYGSDDNGRFKVDVKIKDTKLFKKILKDIYDSQNRILIYGDWNNNVAEIVAKNQIVVHK